MKLLIKSKPETFYRAKMKFTRLPVEVDVDADIATVLINEPMLVVELIAEAGQPLTLTGENMPKVKGQTPTLNAKKRK